MNGEQRLLKMYKRHHHDSTRDNIQRLILILGPVSCLVGIGLTAIVTNVPLSMYSYIGGIVCFAVVMFLRTFRSVSRDTESLVFTLYFCYIYTPIDWYIYGGILGSTPYISLVIIFVIVLMFSGKKQKILLVSYLLLLAGLTVYSIITATGETSDAIVNIVATYFVAVSLILNFLLFVLKIYEQMYRRSLRNSIRDELTGVFNRRALDEIINVEEAYYHRKKTDYIVAMLDIDRFKQMNDEFGHIMGDVVLKEFAACIKENLRATDFIVRYGGDEFLVILTYAGLDDATRIFGRIEKAMNEKLTHDFDITFSRGFARRSESDTAQALIALADQRMYQYKTAVK